MARNLQRGGRELLRLRRNMGRAEEALADLERLLLEDTSLCPTDLSILERLERKGPEPVNSLGQRVGLTSGSITTAVQRLRKRGLVDTARSVKDKRVVSVTISAPGVQLARRLSKHRAEALETVFTSWSSRERGLLQSLLKRLRRSAANTSRRI